jgi:hypothetical protein
MADRAVVGVGAEDRVDEAGTGPVFPLVYSKTIELSAVKVDLAKLKATKLLLQMPVLLS